MKNINKVLSYSSSSFWICFTLTLILKDTFLKSEVYGIALALLTLPIGIMIEPIFSWLYICIKFFIKKCKLDFVIKLIIDRQFKDYFKLENQIEENKKYLKTDGFQSVLSENNFLRNSWFSLSISLIISAFLFNNFENKISEYYIFIGNPLLIIFCLIGNIRTEFYLKKAKFFTFN